MTGVYSIQGERVLVTNSPRIIKPVQGCWSTFRQVIDGLLIDGDIDQRPYLYGWLKRGYESLVSGTFTPGQALCLAGPRECGKSLLQLIITEILGGRSAKPYSFLTGETTFNSDHFAGEHLMIEDDVPSTDIRARRRLGAGIKAVTANTTHRCHAKNKTALILTPFWRLSITVNDEPENLLILPPLDDGLEDKLILLKANKVAMPMPVQSHEERKRFWDTLMSELPAFIHFLVNWQIPEELKSQRWGIKQYHHPSIAEALTEAQPEIRLLSILDEVLFLHQQPSYFQGKIVEHHTPAWEGSAEQLEATITDKECRYAREAQKLLYFSSACGTYLARLKKLHPERIGCRTMHGKRIWEIKPMCFLLEKGE
jgi:energy-coupling factor transporter ATP-binding protein EcfA2